MAIHYIETTIPSFYHEVRPEPSMVARRDWTRRWFDIAITSERIVASVAVLDEQSVARKPHTLIFHISTFTGCGSVNAAVMPQMPDSFPS